MELGISIIFDERVPEFLEGLLGLDAERSGQCLQN